MKKDRRKPKQNNLILLIGVVALIVLIALALSLYLMTQNKEKEESIAYTELLKDIEDGLVEGAA